MIKPPKSMDGFDSDPLETYPCKFDGMYGFLFIWQRYLVFETQKEERVSFMVYVTKGFTFVNNIIISL